MSRARRYLPALAVGALVVLACAARFVPGALSLPAGWLRRGIYIALYAVWGFSVSWRVIQPRQRQMFLAVAALLVFWHVVRTVKYQLPVCDLARYCWYLYYIPILFIPLLTTLIAARLGRGETYRLPRWTAGLFVLAGALALLVLTNDVHQLVFVFPAGKPFSDLDYRYGPGFLLATLWGFGGVLAMLGLIFMRSRIADRRRRLLVPIVPAVLLVLYHVYYLFGRRGTVMWRLLSDMTAVYALLVVCILECCLLVGLIQSNTGYDRLFRAGSDSVVIVDEAGRVRIASGGYIPLAPELMQRAREGGVMLEGGLRLSSAPVQGGRVLWVEDLSELLKVTEELSELGEYLTGRVELLQKEVNAQLKEESLVARNRLYEQVMARLAQSLSTLAELTDRLEESTDPAEVALLSVRQAIACTQVKRSANLIFIEERGERIEASELAFALREWLTGLRAAGAACSLQFRAKSPLSMDQLLPLYAALGRVLLAAAEGLVEARVCIEERDGAPLSVLEVVCTGELAALESEGVSVERVGEKAWRVSIALPKGGEAA